MSHEIRTPMNASIGMTNLVSQNEPREDQKEQIEILNFSSRTLLSLIDDILDFSKIESGKIEFESTPFGLDQLLKSVSESFRFKAEEKGIDFELDRDKEVPSEIVGDPARLTQILNNLLSNAVKFTDVGKVTLGVHLLKKQDRNVDIRFRVADTGIGIEPHKLNEIFDSFTQARSDTTRVFGGTGLGLAICKQLTELQGGTIEVNSTPGEGSIFDITLDFDIVESTEADNKMAEKSTTDNNTLAGSRVLLVEDNMINQKVAARFMQLWDIDLTIANNGIEALQAINQQSPFDLILMDLQMPEMDGYEAAEKIRELGDDRKSKTPILALTAAALQEVRDEVNQAGMNDFIAKPFNPTDLQRKLTKHVYRDGVAT